MFQIILKFKRGKYLIWAPAKLSLRKVLAQERKTLKMERNSNRSSPILWIDKTTAVRNRGAEQVEATLGEELKK